MQKQNMSFLLLCQCTNASAGKAFGSGGGKSSRFGGAGGNGAVPVEPQQHRTNMLQTIKLNLQMSHCCPTVLAAVVCRSACQPHSTTVDLAPASFSAVADEVAQEA